MDFTDSNTRTQFNKYLGELVPKHEWILYKKLKHKQNRAENIYYKIKGKTANIVKLTADGLLQNKTTYENWNVLNKEDLTVLIPRFADTNVCVLW